jgi:hypothetical protein
MICGSQCRNVLQQAHHMLQSARVHQHVHLFAKGCSLD